MSHFEALARPFGQARLARLLLPVKSMVRTFIAVLFLFVVVLAAIKAPAATPSSLASAPAFSAE